MGQDFADGYLTYPTHDAAQSRQCHNCTVGTNTTEPEIPEPEKTRDTTTAPVREKRELSLMTRKTFYTILRDKLDRSELQLKMCSVTNLTVNPLQIWLSR